VKQSWCVCFQSCCAEQVPLLAAGTATTVLSMISQVLFQVSGQGRSRSRSRLVSWQVSGQGRSRMQVSGQGRRFQFGRSCRSCRRRRRAAADRCFSRVVISAIWSCRAVIWACWSSDFVSFVSSRRVGPGPVGGNSCFGPPEGGVSSALIRCCNCRLIKP
jgi:hypothetical protein